MRRRTLAVTLSTALVVTALAVPSAEAGSTSQTFYISNRAGCSDTGAGTSTAQPWCGFEPANAKDLVPGDQLLLERGSSFAAGLVMAASGTAEAPIVIGAYGNGARPKITDSASGTGLTLTDSSHVQVRDLDIGSKTDAGKSRMTYGIRLDYNTPAHQDVEFSDLFVHDNRAVGLMITNAGPYTTTGSVLDGLRVTRVESAHNAHGILTRSLTTPSDLPETPGPGTSGENVLTHAVLDGLYLHDDDNNNPGPTPAQIDSGCPDGLSLGRLQDSILMNSILDNEASCRTTNGTAGIYLAGVHRLLITNNLFVNTPDTASPDKVAIDHEIRTAEVEIRGNYFGNNYGGGIEYLAIHGARDVHVGNVTADNAFAGNGGGARIPYPAGASVGQLGNSVPVRATIAGNLYSEPYAFLAAKFGGTTAPFTIGDNLEIADPADLHNAAAEFGTSSGWTAERLTSQWNELTSLAGIVDRFTLTPGNAAAVARTWTAPHDGVVNIRGNALTTSGTATIRVTTGNRTLLRTAVSTTQDEPTSIDDLRVRAGDRIRFEASGNGTVSWVPSIGYSARTRSSDAAGEWTFSVNGDAQGWHSDDPTTVSRGKLTLTGKGATTTLRSPAGLGIDAAKRRSVRVRMLNSTAATQGVLTFRTSTGQTGRQPFDVNAAQPQGITVGYTDYLIPVSSNAQWAGRIDQLSLEFTGANGTISIDRIAAGAAPQYSWDFSNDDGWKVDPDNSCPSAGTPAAHLSPAVDNSNGSFTKHSDVAWTFDRLQSFRVVSGSLARLDLWAYRTGAPSGCLFLQVVELDDKNQIADRLFTGAIPAGQVSTDGGFVSIHPNLRGLDPNARYGVLVSAPYQAPGGATYGIGYNDQGLYPSGGEFYSVDAGALLRGPEASARRSLRFRTFSSADVVKEPDELVPGTVADGKLTATTGYEPMIYSPSGLGINADAHRYVRIRMNNPQNRAQAYLLFTTTADPEFDHPATGWPPKNEEGGKGIAFALQPGAGYVEYVLDLAAVPGWNGTVDQLLIQPLNRWNYRLGSAAMTWTGGIDYVRVD
ncbi:MAG TPA: right-handed parallel beta-helix repeat-containing protein [Kribbella sp.]